MEKIELPDYLKGLTDDSAKDMVTAVGGGAPRISIRGRTFRFIVGGDEIVTQTDPIHVIVLGVVPESNMAKTFYLQGYQPGSSDPPDCSSFFGEVPDSWVSSPQSDTCRACPHQVWGSATSMNKKKAKACKDSKRLMVMNAKDLVDPDIETPDIYIFNVTIASLKALSTYGKFLTQNNLPMAACITEIAFVDSEFPQVEFTFASVLKEEHGIKTLERASHKEWMDFADKPQLDAPAARPMIQAPNNVPPVNSPPHPADAGDNPPMDNQGTEELLGKW